MLRILSARRAPLAGAAPRWRASVRARDPQDAPHRRLARRGFDRAAALPRRRLVARAFAPRSRTHQGSARGARPAHAAARRAPPPDPCDQKAEFRGIARSEEHTSEIQSLMRTSYAGFCLKKKKNR